MKAVIVESLTKVYASGKQALCNAAFTLDEGEVFGFLGPNGAGKTTTVKLLNGMLSPTGGSCRVLSIDPHAEPEKVHRLSGVVTEHAQMYNHLTGLQNLVFYGTLFGMNVVDSKRQAQTLLQRLALEDSAGQKLATFSTGMRQRLSLARAMMHSPRILFLDEPTAGLDPESAQSVNNMIKDLAQDIGTTVFLCTHQLRYAQEICTTYGLIDEGNILALGDLDALRTLISSGMTVTIRADQYPTDLPWKKQGGAMEIEVQSEEEIPPIVRRIMEDGGSIYHVSARVPSLEEIYFTLIERRKEEVAS